jgi:hypothetical protein
MKPTLFCGISTDMRNNREVIFGPIASVTRPCECDHALVIANDAPMGFRPALARLRWLTRAGQLRAGVPHGRQDRVRIGGLSAASATVCDYAMALRS